MRSLMQILTLLSLLLFLTFNSSYSTAQAATVTVNDEAGLVAAIQAANANPGPDTIVLGANIDLATTTPFPSLYGDNGLPIITGDLVIKGGGYTIRRTSATPFRHLLVNPNVHLWLDNITLKNGNASSGNGGALFIYEGILTLTRSVIGVDGGGNSATEGGGIFNDNGTLVVVDSVITYNTASKYGGGLAVRYGTFTALLVRTQVINNRIAGAFGSGAGIYLEGSYTTPNDLSLIDSAVNNNYFDGNTNGATGGGIYITNAPLTLLNTQVNNNRAVSTGSIAYGGGIFVGDSGNSYATLTMIASEVNNNLVQAGTPSNGRVEGAGIKVQNLKWMLIKDSSISDNTGLSTNGGSSSTAEGGGLFIWNTPTTISGSIISNNHVEMNYTGGSNSCCGGGIKVAGGSMSLTNSTISGNTVHNNSAGAVRAGGLMIQTPTNADIINVTIINNQVTGGAPRGGALVIGGWAVVRMSNTIVSGNSTSSGIDPTCTVYTSPAGTITSRGYNQFSNTSNCLGVPGANDIVASATMGALADNGGPTLTHMPLSTPPINSGNPAVEPSVPASGVACPATDQRGAPRGADRCDIGAVESGAVAPVYNTAPTTVDEDYYARVNMPLSIAAAGVLSNDSDPDNEAFSAYPASPPSNGFVTLNSDGSFVYTPFAGFVGADSFTYRACDARGSCSAPQIVSITVLPLLSAPGNLAANPVPVTQIDLTWIDTNTTETSYLIERSTDSTNFTQIGTVGADVTTYQDDGYTCGTTFYYRVRAYRAADDFYSEYSNVASATIAACPPNQPPVNSVPGTQQTDEDTALIFGAANLASITDPDAGAQPVEVTLAITNGTLSLSGTAGLTFTTGNGTGDTTMVFTGTIVDINAALNGLTYMPTVDFNGTANLSITTNDQGHTGTGGPKSDSDNLDINVRAVNDTPVNAVPGPQETLADLPLAFSASENSLIRVDDPDVDTNAICVTLSVSHGTLTLNSTAGLSFSDGDGTGDPAMTFTGTLTSINAVLDGLIYQPAPGYAGEDTLTLTANDQGYTGMGGAQSDTDTVTISVLPPEVPILRSPPDGTLTNDNTPTFTWNPVTNAAQYRIQVSDEIGFGSPAVNVTVAGMSHTPDVPLADNTIYQWRVQAISIGGAASEWSAVWTLTIDTARLPAPRLQSPGDHVNKADQTPYFEWSSVTRAVEYQLQVSSDITFASTDVDVLRATNAYTVPNGDALPYSIYYWRVRARDTAGNWSDWSLTRTITITILSTPTNAQHVTDATPAFVWKTVTGATAYHLQVYDDAGLSQVVFDFSGLATTVTPVTPLASNQHWWRVQVNRGAGFGEWTPAWTLTVTPPTPLKPTLTSPTTGSTLTMNTPVFTWSSVAGGDRYQIQIDNNDTFASPVQDETLASGVLTYTASPMPDSGKFYWRVRAINSAGVSGAWSSAWNLTLEQIAAPVLISPTNPTTTADNTPAFTWNPASNALSYQLQIGTTTSFATLVHQGSAADTTYTVPGTLPDSKYYWRVRALTAAGVAGKWSAAWVIMIDTTGPAMPILRAPAVNAGTPDTTPAFIWKAAAGAHQYHLLVANNPDFIGPVIDITQASLSYTAPAASALPYGVYYWHVQARDAAGNWGSYSPTNRFTLTLHTLPKDGSATTAVQPTFQWAAAIGAVQYEFVLDDSLDFSAPVVWTYSGTARSTKPAAPLAQGTYYWHVRVNTGGGFGAWMPTWTVIITPPLPTVPGLLAPATATLTNDYTPTLSWKPVINASTYQVQIDNNSTFTSPEQDVTVGAGLTSCIAGDLADGLYSWRVRALNSVGAPGPWSVKRTFTIDTIPAGVPLLVAPLDGASSTNTKLALSWGAVMGAVRYQLQLDSDPAFPLPVVDAGKALTYKSPTPLSRNVYHWHVRSVDKAGNVSEWSETRSFAIVAGVTSPLAPTQTPVPTIEPTLEPTVEPTAELTVEPTTEPTVEPPTEPTTPPEPSLTVIESNDPRVVLTGNWTAHDTALASGGRYLYSSGSSDDTLSLAFSGSRLDAIFVQHPALGSFVLVLDDTPLQTVSSTSSEASFGVRVSLSMGAGQHTLRIIPTNGVIAIDAFAVETMVEPPVLPTDEPTNEPTTEPTVEPTSEPTTESTPDATLPTLTLSVLDNGDSAANWQAKGVWKHGKKAGIQGGGWVADSTRRGAASPLTALVLIDLTTTQAPQLRFWQRMGLSSGDLAAVDISLDGGQTWLPLDQQRGHLADWSERVIDLSAYRGQVIRLRFRLDTQGRVPKGEQSHGWWLDTISVQEATAF